MTSFPCFRFPGLVAIVASLLVAQPAAAVERLTFTLPLLDERISLDLSQATNAQELIDSNPDLQELDWAGDGSVQKLIEALLTAPLPEETSSIVRQSLGHPLFEQLLLSASELVEVKGLPVDTSGRMVSEALAAAYRDDEPHLLGFLRHVPGDELSINLQELAFYAKRLRGNQDDARALVQKGTAAKPVASTIVAAAASGWTRRQSSVAVNHRPQPLQVTVISPTGLSNGRLVVISHGLWDAPSSFEGWAHLLAAHGYSVVLPGHPGSDSKQQQSLLQGKQPPPASEELRLRPMDVTAVIDAVEAGSLLSGSSVQTDSVAVVGHSWGATAALQLGGLQTTSRKLSSRCQDPRDPDRNLSWVLQCSWLKGADQGSLGDTRVRSVVVVSPPLRLLFDESSGPSMHAKALLVSGTRDWVVPSDPEAVVPLRNGQPLANGHRLVLASGGDHFNLWAPVGAEQPPVLGPLILAWINDHLGITDSLSFKGGGWGNQRVPLFDVTGQL
ncbi:alpha/beta fold hydrolase [Synechococcus sp. UW179A]|uniref:alpha/beta hydrolase family protein n=1 Tax=Synechococcus sp. UW179A TaxID=2575510 RepID=UPI000E0F9471|nr:alpha/beta fold hydrolase [Synechococcus sp. UW179A]